MLGTSLYGYAKNVVTEVIAAEREERFLSGHRHQDDFLNVNVFDHSGLAAKPAARWQPGLQRPLKQNVLAFVKDFRPVRLDGQNGPRAGPKGRTGRLCQGGRPRLQRQPVEGMRAKVEKTRLVRDGGKFRAAKQLYRYQRLERGLRQLHRLHEAGQVGASGHTCETTAVRLNLSQQ